MLVKLKDYKIARKYKQDSVEILKVLDLTTRALSLYKYYTPVKKILANIVDERAILMAHLNTAEKLLKKDKDE